MGGLIVHYIPSVLVIVLPPSSEVYSFILEVEGYPGQIFALATSIGLIWMRYKRPDLKRPFKGMTRLSCRSPCLLNSASLDSGCHL